MFENAFGSLICIAKVRISSFKTFSTRMPSALRNLKYTRRNEAKKRERERERKKKQRKQGIKRDQGINGFQESKINVK